MKLLNGIVFLWHSFRRLKHLPIQTCSLTFVVYAAMQEVQEVKEVLKVLHNISVHRYTPTQMEKSSRPLWSSVSHSRTHAAKACTVCHCIRQRNKVSFCVCLSFHSESKEPKRDHKNWSKKKQKTTRNLSALFLVLFCASKEDILILMYERQQGVVPGRLHIPRYHFTYAWEHSNVSYWACKVDVMLSASATHLLKLPVSSHTYSQIHMHTQNILWSDIYLKYGLGHYHFQHYERITEKCEA